MNNIQKIQIEKATNGYSIRVEYEDNTNASIYISETEEFVIDLIKMMLRAD